MDNHEAARGLVEDFYAVLGISSIRRSIVQTRCCLVAIIGRSSRIVEPSDSEAKSPI